MLPQAAAGLVYILFQRRFVQGMTAGALRG